MNPWIKHDLKKGKLFARAGESVEIDNAYFDPEHRATVLCCCGRDAYFKATVGTHVCLCGLLYSRGQWI